jgi:hypothetical protein
MLQVYPIDYMCLLSRELFVDFKNSTDEIPEGISQMTSEEAAKIVADFV